jgi:hypothetical protein
MENFNPQESLNQAAGNEALNPQHGETFVDWAIEMLCFGETNENIAILAGLREPLYEPEVLRYLHLAARELGLDVTLLTAPEALWYGIQNVARQIVAGEIKPKAACIQMLDVYDELSPYDHLSSPIRDIAHLVYYYDEEIEDDGNLDEKAIEAANILLRLSMPRSEKF